jgi:flagellar biosynthesis GTPase FlhF
MSTMTSNEPRTYRGTDLEKLLPKIRAELGPDAIVLRQRDGLEGGFGGFFRRRCVEVVARRGAPGVDLYDEGPEPEPEPAAPAIREIMRLASPFVQQLQAAQVHAASESRAPEPRVREPEPRVREPELRAREPELRVPESQRRAPEPEPRAWEPELRAPEPALRMREPDPRLQEPEPRAPEPELRAPESQPRAPERRPQPRSPEPQQRAPEPEPQPHAPEPRPVARVEEELATESAPRVGAAATHARALVAAGIAPALAAEILAATISHAVPFAPNRPLKHLVRDALAARIPLAPPVAPGRRTIAFVGAGGAGKTLCATRLAAAYAAGSNLDVRVLNLAGGLPGPDDAGPVLTVIDTPSVSPAAGAEARAALARQLRRLGPCDVHVVVPATFSAAAVRRLLDGLAPMKPAAIVITHLDEVDHAGPVLDEAIARGLALSYCNDARRLTPADPAALAARVLA